MRPCLRILLLLACAALAPVIGYSDQPSVMQVIVYVLTLAVITALSKAFAPPQRRAGAPTSANKSSVASA